MKTKYLLKYLSVLTVALSLSSCVIQNKIDNNTATTKSFKVKDEISLKDVPKYSGSPFAYVNDNQSDFKTYEIKKATKSYKYFSPLDSLGRCGKAEASLGLDTMPKEGEERQSISSVSPSGWGYNKKYDFVDGGWLYNRSHLIGYQLSSENANEKNLITGTRSFNVDGMLPFENLTANYLKKNEGRVLYEVIPVYDGDNLVASGVQMKACSVADDCASLNFNVYVYNVEDGVTIDYSTGSNYQTLSTKTNKNKTNELEDNSSSTQEYVLNTSSKKIHLPNCPSVKKISDHNRNETMTSLDVLKNEGYSPCQYCLKGK